MKVLPVSSYKDYRCIVKGKKLVNNGFLPNDIKKYVSQNRLFYGYSGNRLFLFYDEAKYYQLVCEGVGSDEEIELMDFESSKPVACHIVENNKNDLTTGIIRILQKNAFILRCTIHEYVRENLADLQVPYNKDFFTRNVIEDMSECQNVLSLWQDNLPLYEVSHMLPEEVQALSDKNRIVCLKEFSTGKLAGACFYDVFLGTTTIHHIVIDPAFRGKGCAEILLTSWLEQAGRLGTKTARSWIEDENISSQKCFSKIGFFKTSNHSYQFIKL